MSAQPRLPAGFTLHVHDRLTSTNDEAKRLAGDGAPHGTVVWARTQSAGRGRRGRAWDSPAGNLYVSFLLRVAIPADRAAQAGFAAALALAETAEAVLPPTSEVRCKWPNDLLVNGRKAAGILLESAPGADGMLDWLVVGCGLNCAHHPAESRWPATDLAAEGATEGAGEGGSAEAALERLVPAFDAWLARWQRDGFAPVRDAWLARGFGVCGTVALSQGETVIEGVFAGLDADGALRLDRGGRVTTHRSGEVTVAGP